MKESISSVALFIIVITLVILFAGIVSFSTNKSNAFAVKDEIVSVIEKYGVFDVNAQISDLQSEGHETLQEIVDVMSSMSYRQKGNCEETVERLGYNSENIAGFAGYSRDGSMNSRESAFCVIKVKGSEISYEDTYYYRVVVFYSLDIPIINSIFNFTNIGETKILYK